MDHMTQSAQANTYIPVSGSPPIPPRGSTLPQKPLKASPPEVKKKKTKKAENSKTVESPLLRDISKEIMADERYGSKENLLAPPVHDMSLLEFVKNYSRLLPQRIKVVNGYCGNSNRLTISANDMYNIHLLKHVRVVRVKDTMGTSYSIPVNSSIEFGLVFDPTEDRRVSQVAISGFNLRISDIFTLPSLPKLMCCMSNWSSSEGIELEEGEVLVLKEVLKPRKKSKKALKVYSIKKNKELTIPDHCMCLFSTRPRHVKLTLPSIMDHVQDPFPCAATLHLADDLYHKPTTAAMIQDMSDKFLTEVIKVAGVVTESSLIAKALYPEGIPKSEFPDELIDEYVDIPLEGELLSIEVTPVQADDDETKIYDDTLSIYEKFDPSKLKCIKEMSSNQASATQSLFYASVKEGMEKHGVELDEPTVAYVSMTSKQRTAIITAAATTARYSIKEKSLSCDKLNEYNAVEDDDDSDGYETVKLPQSGHGKSTAGSMGNKGYTGDKEYHSASGRFMSTQSKDKYYLPPGNKRHQGVIKPPPPPPPFPPEHSNVPHPSPPNVSHSSSLHSLRSQESPTQDRSEVVASPSPQSPSKVHSQERFKKKLPIPNSAQSPGRQVEPVMNVRMPHQQNIAAECAAIDSNSKEIAAEQKIAALEERVGKVETMIDLLERASQKEKEQMMEQIQLLTHKIQNGVRSPDRQRTKMEVEEDEANEVDTDANKRTLSKLSSSQILNILDNMELSKYKNFFREEQVCGDILLEFTEDILKEELQVNSKIHRIRLMKLISGAYSPLKFLSSGHK